MADETGDAGAGFAALMSEAQQQARPEAPHGMTKDKTTGQWRPKKSQGRPPRNPVADDAQPETASRNLASAPPAAESAESAPAQDDPDPGWMTGPDPIWLQDHRLRRQSIEDVPREVVDDMAGLAGLVGAPIMAILQQADPYCGTVLAQNFEPTVDAVLPLVCRSEKIVSYFSGDKSDWLLWGKLAMALAPVGRAIVEHHITGSVQVVRDPATGVVEIVRRQKGESEMGDHLVPPAPDSSAYAA